MLNADAYDAYARGHISNGQLGELEELEELLKVASIGDHFRRAAKSEAGKTVGSALLHGAAGAGTTLLGAAAWEGGKKLYDKATYGRDMNRILEVYPHLKEFSERDRQLAYTSLRHMNPHFAKDPLVGGTMLGQILRQRDPSNPDSIRFDGSLASDLVKSRIRDDDPMRKTLTDSLSRGVMQGIERRQRVRDTLGDRKWRDAGAADERAWRTGQSDTDRKHRAAENRANRRADKLKQERGFGHDQLMSAAREIHSEDLEYTKDKYKQHQQEQAHNLKLDQMARAKELDWYTGPTGTKRVQLIGQDAMGNDLYEDRPYDHREEVKSRSQLRNRLHDIGMALPPRPIGP